MTHVFSEETKLRAGFASRCITPPIGTRMMGYGTRTEGCVGVFDDLYAQSLAWSVGGATMVVVALDVSALSTRQLAMIRSACTHLVAPDALWVNTSHTHAGPITADRPTLPPHDDYMAWLAERVSEAVAASLADLCPAALSCGEAPVALGANRRCRLPDGRIGMRPNPDGPTLPVMSVWKLTRGEMAPIIVFSTPQHGVTMGQDNRYISAEWMGAARRDIMRELPGCSAMFLQGCAGDQNPWRERLNYEQTVDNGRIASQAVLAALQALEPVIVEDLVVLGQDVAVPLVDGRSWSIRVQAARLGQALLVSYAGEAFVEYALRTRAVSAADATLVLGYTQGSEGYICTAQAQDEGGYEAEANSAFPVGCAFGAETEQLLHAATDTLLSQLSLRSPINGAGESR